MQSGSLSALIDKNVTLTYGEHLHVETAEHIRGMVRSTLKLTGNPLPVRKAEIEAQFDCPVQWAAPTKPTIRPHESLAVIRDAIRPIFQDMVNMHKRLKTLVVGAANREVRQYQLNESVHFSFHDSEAKDENRIFQPMQARIAELVTDAKKLSDDLSDVAIDFELDSKGLVDLYADVLGMEGRLGFRRERSGERFDRLLYEDAHYNKTAEEMYEDFRSTGAGSALIIGLLPIELTGEVCPESSLYRFSKTAAGKARMTDYRGYANGYTHDFDAWATWLNAPAYQGAEFNLVAEILVWVGPMAIINVARTQKGGTITRDLTLFPKGGYVKVADFSYLAKMPETAAEAWLKRKADLKRFFLMTEEEYSMVYNYVASLDPKAVTLTTIIAFIRKRAGGAALIDKVFTKKWELLEGQYVLLAAVVILRVARDKELLGNAMDSLFIDGFWAGLWRSALQKVKLPKWFAKLLWKENLVDRLVEKHDPILEQTVELGGHDGRMTYMIHGPKESRGEINLVDKKDQCKMCAMFPWLHKRCEDDEQEMVCGTDFKETTFGLTDAEVDSFRNAMLPEDTDEEGLRRVKEAARKKLPTRAFATKCEMVFLLGAFGTGKSYQIKKKISETDGVIAPFRKLMDDYDTDAKGNKIWFKTLHRAIIDARSTDTLFVDECSSVPYEFLSTIIYLCQPNRVVLVGDFKQTKTLPSEGICLDRRLNIEGAHYLLKNFRNNFEVIEWAIKTQGYTLKPCKNTQPGELFKILAPGAEVPDGVATISPDRALVDVEETENTVRAYQGQTADDICIALTPESLRVWASPSIKLVGLTRARNNTYIKLLDGCSEDAFRALVRKVEYAAVSDKAKLRTKKVQAGRLIVALRKRVEAARIADLIRAFPDEIQEELTEEKEKRQKLEMFRERSAEMPEPQSEGESEEEDKEDEFDRELAAAFNNVDDDEKTDEEEERPLPQLPEESIDDPVETEDDYDFCMLEEDELLICAEFDTCPESRMFYDHEEASFEYHGCECECYRLLPLRWEQVDSDESDDDEDEGDVAGGEGDGNSDGGPDVDKDLPEPPKEEDDASDADTEERLDALERAWSEALGEAMEVPDCESVDWEGVDRGCSMTAPLEEPPFSEASSVDEQVWAEFVEAYEAPVLAATTVATAVAAPVVFTGLAAAAVATASSKLVPSLTLAATTAWAVSEVKAKLFDRRSELVKACDEVEKKKFGEVLDDDVREMMAAQREARRVDEEFWRAGGPAAEEELAKEERLGRKLTVPALLFKSSQTNVLRLRKDNAEGVTADKTSVIETRIPIVPNAKADQQGWEERAEKYVAQVLLVEREIEEAVPELKAPVYRPSADSFLDAKEQDVWGQLEGARINSISRMQQGVFTGKLVGDPTETRKNAAGNYKKPRQVKKIGSGVNLTYHTDDALGQVATLAERYCCLKKRYELDEEGRKLARAIAVNAFEEIVDKEKLAKEWQDVRDGTVYQGWLKKAKEAAYAASHDLLAEESGRIVRYHGKEIVKPKQELTADGTLKVGQGISAWSKEACTFFGAACRIISNLEFAVLKSCAVVNNGITDEEAVKRFMEAAVELPTFEGVTLDVTQMDSRVNEFIFEILKQFDLLLGVDSEFLELYYSMHADYTMFSEDVKMQLRWVMTSGAPWTFKGNTNTVAILECWIFSGEGPWARFWQGDDARRNQARIKLVQDRVDQLALYTGFEMTMTFSEYGDLCGFIFSHGLVVPSVRRKLCKLLGTEFRSVEHFQQYQISLRDWVNSLKGSLSYSDAILVNAENNGVSAEAVENWIDVLDSMGHIDADQFESIMMTHREEYKFIKANGYVEFV